MISMESRSAPAPDRACRSLHPRSWLADRWVEVVARRRDQPGDPSPLRGQGTSCQGDSMYVVHATKALLDRVGLTDPASEVESTTLLGPWFATIATGRPQIALLVNEATLLPVLLPLAPSRSLFRRFPTALADVLAAHGMSQGVIDAELVAMSEDVTRRTGEPQHGRHARRVHLLDRPPPPGSSWSRPDAVVRRPGPNTVQPALQAPRQSGQGALGLRRRAQLTTEGFTSARPQTWRKSDR